jgi:archaellum biogenesis protein FlaJ (TadC family)
MWMDEQEETFFQKKWRQLEEFYAGTGYTLSLRKFIMIMFFLAILGVGLTFAMTLLIKVESYTRVILPVVAFFSMLSLIVGLPLYMRNTRVSKIDSALPDVLKHISSVLKAGGTIESALEEVSEADYGPMSTVISQGLKHLREGKTIDDVIIEMASDSGSRLFKRTAKIIVDSKKSGAGLSEVLEAIAGNTRDVMHIQRERQSRTTMHVSFLYITSILLVPFIFGFTIAIIKFISTGMAAANMQGSNPLGNFDLLLIIFQMILVTVSNIAAGIISEGKFENKLVYVPFMMFTALAIYQGGWFLGQLMIKGNGG